MRVLLIILLIISTQTPRLQAQSADTTAVPVQHLHDVEIVSRSQAQTQYLATVPVQSLGSDELTKIGALSVADAVKQFNGIVLKDYGGIGGLKTIAVRGMGAEHTAVVYDGVLVNNSQSGQVDIGRFALDNVSYISLNIGQPEDILQTARALASSGVLSIQSSKPGFDNRDYTAHLRVTAGSFGLFNPMLDYSRKLNNTFAISANTSWQRADGNYPFDLTNGSTTTREKRNNSDVNIFRSEVNAYSDFGRSGTLDTKVYYYNSERGLPGGVTYYNPYAAERLWDRTVFVQTGYSKQFGKQIEYKARIKYDNAYTRYEDVPNASIKVKNTYREQEVYLSNALKYIFNQQLAVALAEDLSYNSFNTSFASRGDGAVDPRRYNSLTALSAQYNTDRLSVNARILGAYISEKVKINTPDNVYKKLSPGLSLSYQPFDEYKLRVRLSYKEGFRIPSFNEMFLTAIPKTLKPEKARQFNLGTTWLKSFDSFSQNTLRLSLDAYYNRLSDKIVIIPGAFISQVTNLGRVDIKGIDAKAEFNASLSDNISLRINTAYSYMHAVDRTDKAREEYNKQIQYTPRHSGSASATIATHWCDVTYSVIAAGRRYTKLQDQEAKIYQVDGYTDHSLSLFRSFRIGGNTLYAQATISNIWGENYDVIKFYPMPGRSYQITAGYKF